MKKLMILGSSKYFENLVITAKSMGIYTIVCDGFKNSPAKKVCDEAIDIDVFDLEKLKMLAIEKKIDGVISGFSDILIKPYTYIANELGLPCVITNDQLESVTNKEVMKGIFKENNIKSIDYCILNSINELDKLSGLKYPLVIKPLDSSGSKGIYFVDNELELKDNFDNAKEYSSNGKVLVEEFYESTEIQGLAWVNDGEAHVMYIGDRELVNIHKGRPGKPKRLLYPSIYCYQYEDEIKEIYQKIATAFGIKNGPIYAQMLVGKDGIKVAEAMTRLPGGCDYLAISKATGFDIGALVINFCIGEKIDFNEVKKVNMRLDKCVYALPIYLKAGKISKIIGRDKIEELDYVFETFFNVEEGDEVGNTGDMKQDCGRFFGIAENIYVANKAEKTIQSMLNILDENGERMINNF